MHNAAGRTTSSHAVDRAARASVGRKRRRENDRDRVLHHRVEDLRRDEDVEDSAQHPAHRQPEVELRKVRHRGPVLRQLAVTYERGEEERRQVRWRERRDAALHHERDRHSEDQQERRLEPQGESVAEDRRPSARTRSRT